MTSMGNKHIENIEVRDEVWFFDEKTGERTLKKVVNLSRNTTKNGFIYYSNLKMEILKK